VSDQSSPATPLQDILTGLTQTDLAVKDIADNSNSLTFANSIAAPLASYSSANNSNGTSITVALCTVLPSRSPEQDSVHGILLPPVEGGGEFGGSFGGVQQCHHLRLIYGGASAWSRVFAGEAVMKAKIVDAVGGGTKRGREEISSSQMMPPPPPVLPSQIGNNEISNNTEASNSNEEALEEIIKHYDLLDRQSSKADSKIFHLRNFNNWVKTCLINEAIDFPDPSDADNGKGKKNKLARDKGRSGAKKTLKVFDFACGKGGDLQKFFRRAKEVGRDLIRYVGTDIAGESLREAGARISSISQSFKGVNNKVSYGFLRGDFGSNMKLHRRSDLNGGDMTTKDMVAGEVEVIVESSPNAGIVQQNELFDVVSCQFALHYALGSRQRAINAFKTASDKLRPGGKFIVTTMDSRIVLMHLLNKQGKREIEGDKSLCEIVLGGGGCKLTFDQTVIDKILPPKTAKRKSQHVQEEGFGLEYYFELYDNMDGGAGTKSAVKSPEWLAPVPVLKRVAEEASGGKLKFVSVRNFHELYEEKKWLHKDALYAMNVLNVGGSISEEEWEIIHLYCAVVFEKAGGDDAVVEDEKREESAPGVEEEETQKVKKEEKVLDRDEIMRRQQLAAEQLKKSSILSGVEEKKSMTMADAIRAIKGEMGKRWDDLDRATQMKMIEYKMAS